VLQPLLKEPGSALPRVCFISANKACHANPAGTTKVEKPQTPLILPNPGDLRLTERVAGVGVLLW
jgi:hypothetical protein